MNKFLKRVDLAKGTGGHVH